MQQPDQIRSIALGLASTEEVRARSFGAVTRAATFDAETGEAVPGGLFCSAIFGQPTATSCVCGKVSGPDTEGRTCSECGSASGEGVAHRRRAGHIDLAEAVVHPWLLYLPPHPIASLLSIDRDDAIAVAHCRKSLVIPNEAGTLHVVDDVEGPDRQTGAAALREALRGADLGALAAAGEFDRAWLARSVRKSGMAPETLVLDAIPVLPAGLRPRAHLADGIAVTVQANDLYLTVLERNERLGNALQAGVPKPLQLDLQRALQEAVESLLDVREHRDRSLATVLRGKEGLFRRNILGKLQDYSGRSVITPAPDLKLHEVGLPEEMALELFRPFVLGTLLKTRRASTLVGARKMVECQVGEVKEALVSVLEHHPVLMNRAPTLHRLGIQAFNPRPVAGQAIALHPLVCKAFNADFDGDQMAVHVPLTAAAIDEAKTLLFAPHNLFSPGTGEPLAGPTQEMVLGCAYLTRPPDGGRRPIALASLDEVQVAAAADRLPLTAPVTVPWEGGTLDTTPGRVLFNRALPAGLRFVNESMDRSKLEDLVTRCRDEAGPEAAAELVNRLHDLGFRHASRWGLSVSWADYPQLPDRPETIAQATEAEAAAAEPEAKLAVWTDLADAMSGQTRQWLAADREEGHALQAIVATGARANVRVLREAAGIVGPIAGTGTRFERPQVILHSFLDGLRPAEFVARCRVSRFDLSKVMLKLTACGYLGRQLVAAAGDITTVEDDCGTGNGLKIKADAMDLSGRRLAEGPKTDDGREPAPSGAVIDQELASQMAEAGLQEVTVRSPLTCETRGGICAACYGYSPETGRPVPLGSAVGVNAAMSLTEAATQLVYGTDYGPTSAGQPPTQPAPSGLVRLLALVDARGVGLGPQRERWVTPEQAMDECGEAGIGAAICDDMAGLYAQQGCLLDRRHFEVIARALLSRVRVTDPGDTELLRAEVILRDRALALCDQMGGAGKAPPAFETIVSGAAAVVQANESFLAAASFGRTSEVLLRAALSGARDELRGIRESLIVGKLVPVGTGFAALPAAGG